MTKTNAARLLDSLKVSYELIQYEVDDSDLSAITVANKLSQSIDQVFKTLVLRGNKTGYLVCIIPSGEELDLKKAAQISGNKNVTMIPMKDILKITGYIRGGCSPLSMKKQFPTIIDESCQFFDFIFVSGGIRGVQIKIAPDDLINSVPCELSDLIV